MNGRLCLFLTRSVSLFPPLLNLFAALPPFEDAALSGSHMMSVRKDETRCAAIHRRREPVRQNSGFSLKHVFYDT